MSFEQRNNSGALFKNDKKEKDTHPDYKGTCQIDNQTYYISARDVCELLAMEESEWDEMSEERDQVPF